MVLPRVPLGARFRITAIRASSPVAHRLMELGLIEGAEGRLLRRAPLGDPLHLRVGDYELAVRASEASLIEVKAL